MSGTVPTGQERRGLAAGQGQALVAGALLAMLLAFFVGYGLGSRRTVAAPPPDDFTLMSGVPSSELADLLADVDRTPLADPVDAIAYPALMRGEGTLRVPEEAASPSVGRPTVVRPPRRGSPPAGDPVPSGAWTLTLAETSDRAEAIRWRSWTRDAGVHTWLWLEHSDGEPRWRLALGGFASEADALARGRRLVDGLPAFDNVSWRVEPARLKAEDGAP